MFLCKLPKKESAKCRAAVFPKERKMVTWDSEVEKDV